MTHLCVCVCVHSECMHVCDILSDSVAYHWVFVNVKGLSQSHAHLCVCQSVCSCPSVCVCVTHKLASVTVCCEGTQLSVLSRSEVDEVNFESVSASFKVQDTK